MRLIADIILLLGAVFCFLGALGLIRMPDIYNRIQAGTKAATLGSIAIILGVGLLYPSWWGKLVCISGFLLFTSPVSSSVLARAVYLSGVKPWSHKEKASASLKHQTGEKS
ncbi:MAG: monovalent cation/H(+) antiporter subunit G [Gammaproteobacteria bacterium]|nr:monovalent cation/H(+) antiporter subunit G [Gammaproteobacteria bacterium]MBL7000487.1 monovalent cation/H(+) antiporter subunit G [Gammaproteobacteria bacterium]